MTRIHHLDVRDVFGALRAPRRRYEKLRVAALVAALVVYEVAMVAAFPRETWLVDGSRVRLSLLAVVALIGPMLAALAVIGAWQLRADGAWTGGGVIGLVGDELTLELEGRVVRRVALADAEVRLGRWIARGDVAGPLLVLERGDRLAIGAPARELARDGVEGWPDVEVTEDDFRALVALLGLDRPHDRDAPRG